MARNGVAETTEIRRGANRKVKTGCATCRIRKVKCDEGKPSCQRCTSTGRSCDGYESVFRNYTNHIRRHSPIGDIKPARGFQNTHLDSVEIDPKDIELLNRCLSIKTMFDVKLECDEVARQILTASLNDSPIQHAILSLKILRKDLEMSGYSRSPSEQQTSNRDYGIQQYSMALGGLASNLALLGSDGLKSALLCCQIFISIEQVRKNYGAMIQHVIRGLRIMHEYGARPGLNTTNQLVMPHHDRLPLLDVYIIKLFAAPCKFAEPHITENASRTISPSSWFPEDQERIEPHAFRTIVPDMRTELTVIATSTLQFLERVSKVTTVEAALEMLPEKATLLHSLDVWSNKIRPKQAGSLNDEPVSIGFLRLFHLILKIVLSMVLISSSEFDDELQTESRRLQDLADVLGERLRDYQMFSGIAAARGNSTIR